MEALTPGARAALDLRLQDAKRDLERAVDERNGYCGQAEVFSALAHEATNNTSRVRRNAEAIKYRVRAAGMVKEIADFRSRVALLEGMLAGKAEAPTVLSAEQCAAMDDMAGLAV